MSHYGHMSLRGEARELCPRQEAELERVSHDYRFVRVVGWDNRVQGPVVELAEFEPPQYIAITGRGKRIPAKPPRKEQ